MTHSDRRFLLETNAIELISTYDIGYPEHRFAVSADEAVLAADAMGYPVVLKAVAAEVVHKSDVGGVLLNLRNADMVRKAFSDMKAAIGKNVAGANLSGVLVCQQEPDGVDVIVGGFRDAAFGPAVMVGLGGIFAEVLDDVAFRIAPIDRCEAHLLIREIRSWPLLEGVRGQLRCDIEALVSLIVSVSRLMDEHPEVESLDLNPVRAFKDGARALDVRVEVTGQDPTST